MMNYKIGLGIAIFIIISLSSTTLHYAGVINIIESISNIWFWIVAVSLAIALNLIYQGIKETPKKHTNKTKKDAYLYGANIGSVDKGIHYFKSQDEIPPLNNVLECAKERIEILTWSAEDISTQHIDSIKHAINRDIQVTVMLLAPNSKIAKNGDIAISCIDLPQRIQKSLKILCEVRDRLGDKKQNFKIMKYYVDNNHSMIILDPYTDNAWIQVTSYVKGVDASSRHSNSAFKKENETFFKQYYDEYILITKKSKEHKCK